jgi:hypothetical protein
MSAVILDLLGYMFSNDHELLWELAQKQSVVCRVAYTAKLLSGGSYTCWDICQTISTPQRVSVSVRGCSYVEAETLKDFVFQCEHLKLEWIVPHGAELPLLAQASKGAQP